ncbi:MAG: hemolysin family protein [Planctomycetota bacterium]
MASVLLIIYLLVAIGFSFLCSIAEAVLLSITPSYLAERRKEDSATAKRILRLRENIDRPLAAILSLNTIAHTVGAAGVGAQAAKVYGDAYVGVTSAVLTLLILVFSEIIPKTIGALYWRSLAGPMAVAVDWLILLLFPLVWLSEFLTKLLSKGHQPKLVTREEIAAIADLGTEEGILKSRESKILENLFRLDSVQVQHVMTPRTVVITFEQSRTVESIAEEIKEIPVSRLPIYEERRDHVTGFVLKGDLLMALASGETDKTLEDFRRPIHAVKESDPITQVFDQLLTHRAHIALVVDEFGGMDGIVTLEDVVETLLGLEIVDEHDETADMQMIAREQWRSRLKSKGIEVLDQEEE